MYNPNEVYHPKYYNKATNTYIRALYSPGFSSIIMSFFKTNLTLNFVPWLGKDNRGFDKYDKKIFLSTTLNYEGASFFYQIAMSILNDEDSEKQIEAVLPCSNNTALVIEYKPDQNGQMSTFLTINKNNGTIPFRFPTHPYKVNLNGQMVTKIRQTGLGVFAMTLEGYLRGTGVNLHLNKLSEEDLDPELTSSPVENNSPYQAI